MQKFACKTLASAIAGRITHSIFLFQILTLTCSDLYAQDIDEVRRQQEQVLGREEIHQKSIQEEFRMHKPQDLEIKKDDETDESKSIIKLTFHSIKLEGVTVLHAFEISDLIGPYTGHAISLSEINNLIRDVTNKYIDKGYISTRVYIPEQDLSSGELVIKVLEGHIEELSINRNNEQASWQKTIPTSKGNLLNMRDLEQGIDQITRLRSYKAEIDIKPGKEDGGSLVNINTHQGKPIFLDTSYDNYGSASTGVNQVEAVTTFEDIIGVYDVWSIHAKRDADFQDRDHYNKSLSYQVAIPYGYWTARYFGSLFAYKSTTSGRVQTFQFSGNNLSHRFELEKVLHRNGAGKTFISFALSHKDSRNYVGDILLEVGSQKITTGSTTLTHMRRMFGGVLTSSLSYTKGLKNFNALKNSEISRGAAKPQFDKVSSDISYYRPFQIMEKDFAFQTKTSGQYTHQTLFSSERISFGGVQTVRGFQKGSLSGDIGFYVRNDLSFDLYNPDQAAFKTVFGKLVGFCGFDYGWIRKDKNEKFEHGVLKSVFTGLRLQEGLASSEIILGKSLKQPSFLRKEGLVLHFRFGLNI